jgi:hypothetical protein
VPDPGFAAGDPFYPRIDRLIDLLEQIRARDQESDRT